MKKSIFAKVGAAAVVLTLVTASLVGGTFAKYTSTVTGTGTAQAAKWAIAFKQDTTAITGETFTFSLVNKNTNAVTPEGVIAPESYGEMKLSVDGTGSEVGYSYVIEADTTNLGDIPVVFYEDEERKTPCTVNGNKITVDGADVEQAAVGTPVEKTIYWAWDNTATDANDTTLGEKTAEADRKGTITLTMTATQLVKTPAAP